jgi:hypothetical protein
MGVVLCGHCGKPAVLINGRVIYPHRPDLADKRFWACAPCAAHVGCHAGTDRPLGSPALRGRPGRRGAEPPPTRRRGRPVSVDRGLVRVFRDVRAVLLRWRALPHHADGGARSTRNCCTVASLAAAAVARDQGFLVEVAWGYFGLFPHTWLVPGAHPRGASGSLVYVDLTADQFFPDAPGVAVVNGGHPVRMYYRLVAWGPDAEADVGNPSESADGLLAREVVDLYRQSRAGVVA